MFAMGCARHHDKKLIAYLNEQKETKFQRVSYSEIRSHCDRDVSNAADYKKKKATFMGAFWHDFWKDMLNGDLKRMERGSCYHSYDEKTTHISLYTF